MGLSLAFSQSDNRRVARGIRTETTSKTEVMVTSAVTVHRWLGEKTNQNSARHRPTLNMSLPTHDHSEGKRLVLNSLIMVQRRRRWILDKRAALADWSSAKCRSTDWRENSVLSKAESRFYGAGRVSWDMNSVILERNQRSAGSLSCTPLQTIESSAGSILKGGSSALRPHPSTSALAA